MYGSSSIQYFVCVLKKKGFRFVVQKLHRCILLGMHHRFLLFVVSFCHLFYLALGGLSDVLFSHRPLEADITHARKNSPSRVERSTQEKVTHFFVCLVALVVAIVVVVVLGSMLFVVVVIVIWNKNRRAI